MRNTFQAPLHLEKFIEQHLTKPLQTKNDHNALRLAKYGSSLHLFYICDWIMTKYICK